MNWILIVAIVLALIRLYESTKQLSQTPEAKTIIQRFIQIAKNFFLDIETYKKK